MSRADVMCKLAARAQYSAGKNIRRREQLVWFDWIRRHELLREHA